MKSHAIYQHDLIAKKQKSFGENILRFIHMKGHASSKGYYSDF